LPWNGVVGRGEREPGRMVAALSAPIRDSLAALGHDPDDVDRHLASACGPIEQTGATITVCAPPMIGCADDDFWFDYA
jgi:hypothetical protein